MSTVFLYNMRTMLSVNQSVGYPMQSSKSNCWALQFIQRMHHELQVTTVVSLASFCTADWSFHLRKDTVSSVTFACSFCVWYV